MTITYKKSRGYKTLRSGDNDFTFSPDGVTLVPRASLEFSSNCPRNTALMIQQALENGWIKPVAVMRDTEYLMEILR